MKKILLVYPGFIVREVPLNILYISAALRQAGYDTKVFELTKYLRKNSIVNPLKRILSDLSELLDYYQPDMVGFSVMTVGYYLTREMAYVVKQKGIKVIFGGIHPTIAPEQTITESFVDFVCVGEGETSFVNLLNSYFADEDYRHTGGIWSKDTNGEIYSNEVESLATDLDSIPFPDRDALDSRYYNAELTGANVLTSRGCPYPCSFCQNKFLLNLYKGKGPFVRYRSVENIFGELQLIISKYGAKSFYFSDETFTMNKKRTLDFLNKYRLRFKSMPFMCETRIDCVDNEIMEALKEAGCHQLNIAIESGNESIRNQVLNKKISDEQIRTAFRLAKKYNIKTQSFNMIGIPGETMENIFETISINKEVRPDRVLCTIFMPFGGTELGEACIEKGMIIADIKDSSIYYSQVTIQHEDLSPGQLIGYQGFFDWYIALSRRLYFLVGLFRMIYQFLVPPMPYKNSLLNYFREKIIELIYQSKRFIMVKTIKNR
ncbi:B12-binding domain-containing radical SAM protein [Chloroflexota bacterium]